MSFTSKVAGSNLSWNFFELAMRLEPSPHVKRVKVDTLLKVVGFLQVLRFPPTGKVDRVGDKTHNNSANGQTLGTRLTLVGICCRGGHVLVGKTK